jgi:predicted RNA-binding Zn ribbon-like protein
MNTLWLDLLNSDWHDYKGSGRHEDRLLKDAWLINFLAPWRSSLNAKPLGKIRNALMELRSLLRRMIENYSVRRPIAKKDLDAFNEILRRSPVINKVACTGSDYLLKQEYKNPGIQALLSDIAASFTEVLVSGEPERVKTCQNPDCLWIFYDNSKNHSRKWCENATGCGNLMKVRKHRARVKAGR